MPRQHTIKISSSSTSRLLIEDFEELTPEVDTLNIESISGWGCDDELALRVNQVIKTIPPHIKTLNLTEQPSVNLFEALSPGGFVWGSIGFFLESLKYKTPPEADINSYNQKVANYYAIIPSHVQKLSLRFKPYMIPNFAHLPPNVTELRLNHIDIIGLSKKQLVSLGKNLAYLTTLHVIREDGVEIENDRTKAIKLHIGSHYTGETYTGRFKLLTNCIDRDSAALVLSYITGVNTKEFVKQQHARQRNANFELNCLIALNHFNSSALMIGKIALILSPLIGLQATPISLGIIGLGSNYFFGEKIKFHMDEDDKAAENKCLPL